MCGIEGRTVIECDLLDAVHITWARNYRPACCTLIALVLSGAEQRLYMSQYEGEGWTVTRGHVCLLSS